MTRRGQQLLAERAVAVTGVLDHLRCGLGISLQVRFRCRPGTGSGRRRRGIAALSTPRFVASHRQRRRRCGVRRAHHRDVMSVLVGGLAGTRTSSRPKPWSSCASSLRSRSGTPGCSDRMRSRLLRPDGAVPGTPPRVARARAAHRAGVRDRARCSPPTAGRPTRRSRRPSAISDSTAARRVESLVRRGCLRFRTVFDAALIGLDVEFLQWLTVEPGELENVGAQLAKEGSTRYVSATTGRLQPLPARRAARLRRSLPLHDGRGRRAAGRPHRGHDVAGAHAEARLGTRRHRRRQQGAIAMSRAEPWQWDEPTWRGHVDRVRAGRPPGAGALAGRGPGGGGASRSTPTTRRSRCATVRRGRASSPRASTAPGSRCRGSCACSPSTSARAASSCPPCRRCCTPARCEAYVAGGHELGRPRLDPRAQHAARPRGRARPHRPRRWTRWRS